MHTCEEILDLLSARLDGPLSEAEEKILCAHLADCPDCAALAKDLETLHNLLPCLNETPPDSIRENVMEKIRGETVVPFPAKKSYHKIWKTWGGVAAMFAVVMLSYLALRGAPNGGSTLFHAPAAMAPAAVQSEAAPKEAPAPEPSATPEIANSAGANAFDGTGGVAGDAAPTEEPVSTYTTTSKPETKRSAPAPSPTSTPEPSPQAEPPQSMIRTMTILPEPLTPAQAAQRLYEEKFAETWTGASFHEGEDFLGYAVPGMSLVYVGLSEDGAAHVFQQITDDGSTRVEGPRYLVPLNGGEIIELQKDPSPE